MIRTLKKTIWGLAVLLLAASPSMAAPAHGGSFSIPGLTSGSSVPWTVLVLFTLLTLIPAILLAVTPFARILVVFHFLRQALGTQNAPTNQTLVGLALFMTYFIMAPVGTQVYQQAIMPLEKGTITPIVALERSAGPLRTFMLKYTREKDLAVFVELAHEPRPRNPQELSLRVIIPAYMISELKAGFQVGLVLFLPFLVIDLAVAAITTSVGMMQLPPVIISTPLKILLFVMVDGWNLVVGSMMKSFF
jgi:flagellar biosynthesis protein FliP